MARTYFSKERNCFVSECNKHEHYAIAFDAITNEPIFDGDAIKGEKFEHGESIPLEFLCFDSSSSHRVKRIIASKDYKFHYINGLPHHYIKNSININYFKVK